MYSDDELESAVHAGALTREAAAAFRAYVAATRATTVVNEEHSSCTRLSPLSLAVDRQALMVSALIYVLYAFMALFQQFGVIGLSFALTALVIGSALLLLSAFWHSTRRALLKAAPISLRRKLPAVQ